MDDYKLKLPKPLISSRCTILFDTEEEAKAAFELFTKFRKRALKALKKDQDLEFKRFLNMSFGEVCKMGSYPESAGCTCDTATGSESRQCSYCRSDNNSTVDDRERRKKLKCALCPPNRHENAKRKPKHGAKKPKRKK